MKKAFTLIEVMVVLSILALIAILAYNLFGNTMKDAKLEQAAIKMYNDLRMISEAMELYTNDNNGSETGVSTGGGINRISGLVSGGYLKSAPIPDQNYVIDATTRYYDWTNGYMDFGGPTTGQDWVIYSPDGYISDALCKKINDMYTDYGPNIFDVAANGWDMGMQGVDFNGPIHCQNFAGTGAVDENTVYYFHHMW